MHDDDARPSIPLEMNFGEKIQLAEVIHLKFALEARLQLVGHIYIDCQNDKVVYIYDYNYNVVEIL